MKRNGPRALTRIATVATVIGALTIAIVGCYIGGEGDCGPGMYNRGNNQCAPSGPSILPPPCTTDDNCDNPEIGLCNATTGQCSKPANPVCHRDDDCREGAACFDPRSSGVCITKCDATNPCPIGYMCEYVNAPGLCKLFGRSCEPTNPSIAPCELGTACVNKHCVAACADGGVCGPGLVCKDGGCIMDRSLARPDGGLDSRADGGDSGATEDAGGE
jgi:hypothetical protein